MPVRVQRQAVSLAVALVVALTALLFIPTAAPAAEAPATVALVNPANGKWHVQFADGTSTDFYFGVGADTPIVGDWDCDGIDTPGMYRSSSGFAYLRNSNSTGIADLSFHFGMRGDIPLAGDWDGDGCDTLAVYRDGHIFISNTLGEDGGSFVADSDYWFGVDGDVPFVGDFDADGRDTIGLHRRGTGLVYFTNRHPEAGSVALTETSFYFGVSGDEVVAGDWLAGGVDSVGVFRASDVAFYLNYANEVAAADAVVSFGEGGWTPVAGNFTGTLQYPPTANADELAVVGGGSGGGNVLSNDTSNVPPRVDSLPPTLAAELTSLPTHGAVALESDGTFTYTHDGSENHQDSFSYIAYDAEGGSNPAIVSITIEPVNDKVPVANGDEFFVAEGGTLVAASVLANDTDADVPADVLTAEVVEGPAHGELALAADGTFIYVHDGTENHLDSFTYVAGDGVHASEAAEVAITITPVNDQVPAAAGFGYEIPEGGDLGVPAVEGLLSAATDADLPGDELTVSLAEAPLHGTAVVNPDGSFEYYHDDSENFADGFTFVVFDGVNTSVPYSVEIAITPVNDNIPVASAMAFAESTEGANLEIGAASGLLSEATDADLPGDELSVVILEGTTRGELTAFSDGSFTYGHDDTENHSDSFVYAVTDGEFTSDPATVTIEVEPVNDNAPATVGEAYGLAELAMLEVGAVEGVLANDSDIDVPADNLTAVLVDGPSFAAAFSLSSDGAFSYDYDEAFEQFEDSFTYEVFDGLNTSAPTTVTIEITPVNDHTPEAAADSYTLDEGATLEAASVLANDADIDVPANELSAVAADAPAYGELTLNADGTFVYVHDGSENHADSFTYTVTDGEFTSEPATVSLAMNPVNDPPVASGDTALFDENLPIGGIVAGVTASDPDDVSHTFEITAGNEAGKFSIDAATGSIKTAALIDYETDPTSYTLTVQASDAEPLSDSATVEITIKDVNEAPVLSVGTAYDVSENLGATTPINGTTPSATDVDAGDTQAYSVSGSELVAIDEATGALTLTGPFDHEAIPSVEVMVKVTDSGGLSDSEMITITVNDIDEVPEIEDQVMAVDENSAITTLVGTVAAADPEETALTYGITAGNGAGVFAIDTSNGDIKIADDALLDYEVYATSYDLTVEVADATGLTSSATVTVNLNDVNESPSVILGSAYDVDENSGDGTAVTGDAASVSDVDAGDSHTYAIVGGTGLGLFEIGEASGELSVAAGATLDHEAIGSYTLTIEVTDSGALTSSGGITVTINDVNDAPEVLVDDVYSVEENSVGGTAVTGATPAASDDDGVGPATHTFAIIGGTGAGQFDIDPSTGALTVKEGAALDHETAPTLTLVVQVTDPGLLKGSSEITVSITDAPNDPPVLTVGSAYAVDENSPALTPVSGDAAAATDDDGDALSFAITGGSGETLFAIDGETGVISVAAFASLDFEGTSSYTLEVTVSDPSLASDSATITVELNDVNEAPAIDEGQSYEMSYLANNLDVIGNVGAFDVDAGDSLSYGIINGNPNGVFTILGNGDLRVADNSTVGLDDTYVLTIKVTDSGGLTDQDTVTVWVNRSPSVSDQGFTVPENSANATSVGFIAASDPDAPPQDLTWTVTGGTGTTVFAVNSATGEITVVNQAALDYETGAPSYTLNITVSDGGAGGLTDSAVVTVTETNVNETPVIASAGGPYSVPENSPPATAVVGALATFSDVDSPDSHTWSIDPVSSEFDINSSTGALSVKTGASLDYETTTSYNITLKVTDAGGLSDTANVTVAINDVNEAPQITSAGSGYNVDENSVGGTAVASTTGAAASDVDAGDALTWSIDPVSSEFDINSSTGALSVKTGASLDYETTTSYNITLKVTDAGGLSDTANVTVAINDLAEGNATLYITSDNVVDEVWIDGVAVDAGAGWPNWGAVDTHAVEIGPGSTIAIKAHDVGGLGWMGAHIDSAFGTFVTNTTDWVVTYGAAAPPDQGPVKWYEAGYDDSTWAVPIDQGAVGVAGWPAGSAARRLDHSNNATGWFRFTVPSVPATIYVTSDNEVDAVYVDGVAQTLGANSGNWSLADSYSVNVASGSVIAIKGHDWDGLGWIGIEVDVNGTRYGTNGVDPFLIYKEATTYPAQNPAPANADPAADAQGDQWFEANFDTTGWITAPGGAAPGVTGFPAGTPAQRSDHTSQTAWVRFIVP